MKKIALAFSIIFLCWLIWTVSAQAETVNGKASWYDSKSACKYNKDPKCPTASGDSLYALEKEKVSFAASYYFPLKSRVRVCNRVSAQCTEVVILDRGPKRSLNRIIDLCEKSFKRIGNSKEGLINVRVEAL